MTDDCTCTETHLILSLKGEIANRKESGIYYKTLLDFSYNSNRLDGNSLTYEQIRGMYEANALYSIYSAINVDEIIEMLNQFDCFDYIIEHAGDELTDIFIANLYAMLKVGTFDYRANKNIVIQYKAQAKALKKELTEYSSLKEKSVDDILNILVMFENTQPFDDSNGIIGRLIVFKECLANRITPFIFKDDKKVIYFQGIHRWNKTRHHLKDLCFMEQKDYSALMKHYKIES